MATALYDDEYEARLISYLLQNIEFCNQAALVHKGCFHRMEYANLYGAIQFALMKYHTTLTRDMLEKFLSRSLANQKNVDAVKIEERKQLYLNLYDKLLATAVKKEEFKFTVDVLQDLKIKRDLYNTAQKIVEELKIGKSGQDLLKSTEGDIAKAKTQSGLVQITKRMIWEGTEHRKLAYENRRDHPEQYIGVKFGLQELDDITNGMLRGELGIVFARTGKGKTRFLFNYGYNACKMGHNVAYASLEMYIEQIERMWDSREARVSYTRLKKGELSKQEEESYFYVLQQQEKIRNHFYTIDIPRGCTSSLLEAELEEHERKWGKKIDLLLVDYLTLMSCQEHYTSQSERLGHITLGLKQLARVRKIVTFSANQANRAAVSPDTVVVNTEHISLSDQIAPHCDYVGYLNMSPEDRLKNKMHHDVVKYRDGAGKMLEHYTNFDLNYIGDVPLASPGAVMRMNRENK